MVKQKKTTRAKETPEKASATPVASVSKAAKPDQNKVLLTWNRLLALVFAVQAVLVVVLGNSFAVPITTQYLAVDTLASEANGHQVLVTATRHVFDVRLSYVVAIFLVLFAVSHFLMATFYRKRYEAQVRSGVTGSRWITLGLGGAGMVVAVSLLSGITTRDALLFSVALALGGAIATAATLRLKQGPARPLSHWLCGLATIMSVLPWLVLASGSLMGMAWFGGTIPGYLYVIYASALLLLSALILGTHFRMLGRGSWADSYYTEKAYMALGFVAATLLTWQIFVGVLYS